jgi:hypothetical protein
MDDRGDVRLFPEEMADERHDASRNLMQEFDAHLVQPMVDFLDPFDPAVDLHHLP